MSEKVGMTGSHKFKQLILYLAAKSEGDQSFGATKLNKLLFYSDFLAYLTTGSPISGQTYQKLSYGPAPKSLVPVLREMQDEQLCIERERAHFGKTQRQVVPLVEPDLSCFTAKEVDIVHEVLSELRHSSASEVSELSHRFIGWQAAAEGEEIPYETALLAGSPLPPTEAELELCEQLARECGDLSDHPA